MPERAMNRAGLRSEGAIRAALLGLLVSGGLTVGPSRSWGAASIIHVDTPQVTLTPSAQDYANDYVDATGAAGIRIRVKTNNATGLILKVRSSGAGNTIRLGDVLVRTLTPPGNGGVAINNWTPVTLTDLNLWSITTGSNQFINVGADTRVRNLGAYGDNVSAGFTSYSHALVFTVISP